MAITVVCPECGNSHKVKDEAAGKKLRCKGCEKVISIPKPAADSEADPWESLDENDGGEELPPVVRQPAKTRKGSGKKSRSSSGGGMPMAIMVSIGINYVQMAVMAIVIVICIISGNYKVGGGGIRMVVNATLAQGLMNRQKRARWQSIVLDAIGLGTIFFCLGPITFMSSQMDGSPAKATLASGTGTAIIAGVVIQVIVWIVEIVLLMSQPAKDWCSQEQ